MLCEYYDKGCDSRGLFVDFAISNDDSFGEHLNRYDVICLDITLFISEADNIKSVVSNIKSVIIEEVEDVYRDFTH